MENKNVWLVPVPRRCSQCGKPYFRRNRAEVWTSRNPGKKYGWVKEEARVCLACMDIKDSVRMLGVADVQFSRKIVKLPPKRKVEAVHD